MGQYDDIEPERLRADLKRFAELILRLEEEDGLLTSPADLLSIIGELRQKLFAYEVRCSHLLGSGKSSSSTPEPSTEGPEASTDAESESGRIVREARERHDEMIREWSAPPDGETNDGG